MSVTAKQPNSGFTIVELLIVIVVIGILAVIVIVAYNGIQTQAQESAVKSDLSDFYKKMEVFRIQSADGLYPDTIAELSALNAKFNPGAYLISTSGPGVLNLLYCRYDGGTGFALQTVTKSGKKLYVSSKSTTAKEYTGSDVYINGTGGWSAACLTLVGEEGFTSNAGGVASGAIGTSDYGATMGYWHTGNRSPAWHAWTGN